MWARSFPQNVNLEEQWMVCWLDHGCPTAALLGDGFSWLERPASVSRQELKRRERQRAVEDYPVLGQVRAALITDKGVRMARWEKIALLADLLLWGFPQSVAIATAGVDAGTAYGFRDRMIRLGLLGAHCACGRPFKNHTGVCRGTAMTARHGCAVSEEEKRRFRGHWLRSRRDARGRVNRRELAAVLGVSENRVRHLYQVVALSC